MEEKELLKKYENMSLDNFINSTSGLSYTTRALLWFKVNLNKKVTSEQLAIIPGKNDNPISHNMRRIFELRDEKGYDIVNWKDNDSTGLNLKVNEWVLRSLEPVKENIRDRGVNKKIAMEVFTRDNFTCQTCGRMPNDDDPFKPGHKITLHVGHIKAHKNKGEKVSHKLTKDDFITMCNVCNEGLKNDDLKILTLTDRVKEASEEVQYEIFNYLKDKF